MPPYPDSVHSAQIDYSYHIHGPGILETHTWPLVSPTGLPCTVLFRTRSLQTRVTSSESPPATPVLWLGTEVSPLSPPPLPCPLAAGPQLSSPASLLLTLSAGCFLALCCLTVSLRSPVHTSPLPGSPPPRHNCLGVVNSPCRCSEDLGFGSQTARCEAGCSIHLPFYECL